MILPYAMVLYLTVTNTDTGEQLYSSHVTVPKLLYEKLPAMGVCRDMGVRMALVQAEWYRQYFPNASSNVACKWELDIGK